MSIVICCGPSVIDHRLIQVYCESLININFNPIFDKKFEEKKHLYNTMIKPNKIVRFKPIRTIIKQPK